MWNLLCLNQPGIIVDFCVFLEQGFSKAVDKYNKPWATADLLI